jgi:sarcosine oxidase subunit beta
VIVVGAGLVGLATAFWCAKAGLSVAVLDRRPEPVSLTSARSGAGLRAQWLLRHNITMMRDAIALYRDFGTVAGLPGFDVGYVAGGYLYATTTADGQRGLEARAAAQHAAGLDDLELLEGAALRRRFPQLAPEARFGLFRAEDGWLDVGRLAAGFRAGARFDLLTGTEVRGLVRGAGRVTGVVLAEGSLAADAVVLAPGPYALEVARDWAGLDLPLALVDGRLALVRLTGGMPEGVPATIDVDTGAFFRPDGQGGRLTAPLGIPVPAPAVDEAIEAEAGYVARAIDSVARLSPFWRDAAARLDPAATRAIRGQYCVTPDGGPAIGPAPGVPGLWLNLGYGGHGVMGSIEGGRRLARVMTAQDPHDPAGPFAPERLADPARLVADPMTLNTLTQRGLAAAVTETA